MTPAEFLSGSQLYALHDSDQAIRTQRGAFPTDFCEAEALNRDGYGIFHAVNLFHGARRKDNLASVRAWYLEIDEGDKPAQLARLQRAALWPSWVVESKRGYHAYWFAKDATAENYDAIVQDRLIPALDADVAVFDIARILRTPGYMHMKNPAAPFLINTVHASDYIYTEALMLDMFPLTREQEVASDGRQQASLALSSEGSLWAALWKSNQQDLLSRLSGLPSVNGEKFSFRKLRNGNKNIYVNGKPTSCFIDKHGRIGSKSSGGPTVANWLHWYHRDWKRVVRELRTSLPELFAGEQGTCQDSAVGSPMSLPILKASR